MRGTEDIALRHNVVRGAVCISASLFFVQVASLLDTLDIEIFVDSLADLSAGAGGHAWKGSDPHGKEQGSAE